MSYGAGIWLIGLGIAFWIAGTILVAGGVNLRTSRQYATYDIRGEVSEWVSYDNGRTYSRSMLGFPVPGTHVTREELLR